MADKVAQYKITKPLVSAMKSKTSVHTFFVPEHLKIPHVGLLRIMGPPTYMDMIETFLGKQLFELFSHFLSYKAPSNFPK